MSLRDDIYSIFPDAKQGTGYLRCKCPYHTGGQERRPSMSILTEHKGKLEAGFAQCFSCGWTGTFADIARDFGLEYVPDEAVIEVKEAKPVPKINLQPAVYKKDTPYKYSPYLAKRGISEDTQREYRVYERDDEHKVYMPVFSRQGQFLYANARSTTTKFYSIPEYIVKTLAGLDSVDFNKPIAIVESQINMFTLHSARYAHAVATLGVANTLALSAIKKAVGPFLVMMDGDEHGRKAAKKIVDYLGKHRCIVYDFKDGEDVNDLWMACNFNADLFFDEMQKRELH